MCVCVWEGIFYTPVNNLEWCHNKKGGKSEAASLPGRAADVTCHLRLMKVMMTCMSCAYVRHLLRSSTLEPREAEACLRGGVPRRALESRGVRPDDSRFNHRFEPEPELNSNNTPKPAQIVFTLKIQSLYACRSSFSRPSPKKVPSISPRCIFSL